MPLIRRKTVIDGGQHDPVPNQRTVTDSDAALILKTATGIDEDVLSYGDIFSKISMERWKQGKRSVDGLSCQPGHAFPYLFRGMICGVQLGCNTHGLMAALQKQIVRFCSRIHTFSTIEMLKKLRKCHQLFSHGVRICPRTGGAGLKR